MQSVYCYALSICVLLLFCFLSHMHLVQVHCTEQHADDNGEMIRLVCNDIFTGRPLELLLPNNYLIKVSMLQ